MMGHELSTYIYGPSSCPDYVIQRLPCSTPNFSNHTTLLVFPPASCTLKEFDAL